jgi:diaminopimelate epimerase
MLLPLLLIGSCLYNTCMQLDFTKMHGIGNDFVVVDCLTNAPAISDWGSLSEKLCDRKFGIGADGVLLVVPSQKADFGYRMFNPDGSESEMCGNGIRCFGKFVFERGYTQQLEIPVETGAGILSLSLNQSEQSGKIETVRVNMGRPILARASIPMTGENGTGHVINEPLYVEGKAFHITAVSMGNPHAVYFVDTATDESINHYGPLIEKHTSFPRKTNVHEVEVLSPTEIKMLTWERGAGRTLACGTGACGSAVACILNGKTNRSILAHLPGGDLQLEWLDDDAPVFMTGSATEVYRGSVEV